jgi:uncharacterized membrane protein YdjX (TVP38/TMEM64 family)
MSGTSNSVEKTERGGRRRLGLLLLLLLAVGLGALRFAGSDYLEDPRAALALLRSLQAQGWALPAFLLLYALLTTALVPAALLHMVAGAAWGLSGGLAVNVLACNGVACLQFLVARVLGRGRFARLLQRSRLAAFDNVAAREGLRVAISVRAIPFPFVAVNAAGGLSSLRLRDFALGTLIGTLPLIAIYTALADSLVAGVAGAQRRAFLQVLGAGLLLLAATYGPRLWRRYVSRTPAR